MFVYRVVQALNKHGVSYAIVGGYAVALHGAVRGTVDLDLVLTLQRESFVKAEKAFHSIGLQGRLPVNGGQVFDFRKEYIENKNLVAWNFYSPTNPTELVDVIITHDLTEMKVEKIRSGRISINVASIADLIKMKSTTNRPQDIEDVKILKELL